jgi:molybdopterin converting factor small subunit
MAEVKVLFFGMLREIVSKREERLRVEDTLPASDLVQKLASMHGKKFGEFVFERNGKLRPGLAFAVNGDTVDAAQLKRVACRDVNEFVILPPISGGVR